MRKNKKVILLFIVIVGLLFTRNVYAADELTNKVYIKTDVYDWIDNNDLTFSCGSVKNSRSETMSGVSVKVSYSLFGESHTISNCNFTLSSLDISTGSSFTIIEEYDFSNFVGTKTEDETYTIVPGKVTSESLENNNDVFGSYVYEASETVTVYNYNTLDDAGNIGDLYVYQAYFGENDEKSSDLYFGSIQIPQYCVRFKYFVTGNIANKYGDFSVVLPESIATITGNPGDTDEYCTFGAEGEIYITQSLIDNIASETSTVSYNNVSRNTDYDTGIEKDGEITYSDGKYWQDYIVTAKLDSTDSQTGLMYTILPFILLLLVVSGGYLIIRKNSIRD